MAGRGRGATLPAWMTAGQASAAVNPQASSYTNGEPKQFSDKREDKDSRGVRESDQRDSGRRGGDDGRRDGKRDRSRSREKSDRGGRDRGSDDRRDRDSGKRGRSKSPPTSGTSTWKSKRKASNFDVKPPDGVELPPIGVITPVNGVPNSYFSFSNNPLSLVATAAEQGDPNNLATAKSVDLSQHTRHARRIYAGGIPPGASEQDICDYFNRILVRLVHPVRFEVPPVVKAYLNIEKAFAFVELTSIELTNACMSLDGIRFEHWSGNNTIRIRRPNDYRPELVPANLGPIPQFNMDVLGELGASLPGGPGKLFIGGLPYHLADEQIIELLEAFGKVKNFHQVREPGSSLSKGYAFCEYTTTEAAELAIQGLNDMAIADRKLTVRYAAQGQQQQQQQGSMMNMGLGNLLMNGSAADGPYGGLQNNGQPLMIMPAPAYDPYSLTNMTPTRVLKLSNMVTHEELANDAEYEDIKEDVRLECADHGQVILVLIPRVKEGFPMSAEGDIYVQFAHAEHAKSAAFALNGRKFAERTVMVQYFDENKFAQRMLF